MAAVRQRGDRQWEARVRRRGWPTESRTFRTKADALAWAREVEAEIDRGVFVSRTDAERTTLDEALRRYEQEITPLKKGAKQERSRIALWRRDELALRPLPSIRGAAWQRCRVHFMRKALAHAGKSGRRMVSAFIATAFAQNDSEAARQQWRRVADQLRAKLPKLAVLMDDAEADVLA